MRTNDYDMQSVFDTDPQAFAELMAEINEKAWDEPDDADYEDCPW